MYATGMKCIRATEPSSPTYSTVARWYSAQTSHSLPSRYLETSPCGFGSEKQVIRPLWLLPPKPPRKYPLVVVSPTFGFPGGAVRTAGATISATGDATGAVGVAGAGGPDLGSSVGRAPASAGSPPNARVDSKLATSKPDSRNPVVPLRIAAVLTACTRRRCWLGRRCPPDPTRTPRS